MKTWLLLGAGIALALTFWVFAMVTGMWGCGSACQLFMVLGWLALAVAVYAIVLLIRRRRRTARERDAAPPNPAREP